MYSQMVVEIFSAPNLAAGPLSVEGADSTPDSKRRLYREMCQVVQCEEWSVTGLLLPSDRTIGAHTA
jgi:hypothetical protein